MLKHSKYRIKNSSNVRVMVLWWKVWINGIDWYLSTHKMSTVQWTNVSENRSYSTPNTNGVKILSSKNLALNLRGASFQIVTRTEHVNSWTVMKPKPREKLKKKSRCAERGRHETQWALRKRWMSGGGLSVSEGLLTPAGLGTPQLLFHLGFPEIDLIPYFQVPFLLKLIIYL